MLALDANILVYSVDAREHDKQRIAAEIITAAGRRTPSVLALQAIGEFYVASTRKLHLQPADIRARVLDLLAVFRTFPHSSSAVEQAARLAAQGRYFFWDAVLLVSASEAGCTLMLSEDMADGMKFGKMVVRNPFSGSRLSDAANQALGL